MSNDKTKKELSKAKYDAIRLLNFERDYQPSKIQGDQGVGVIAEDKSKNRKNDSIDTKLEKAYNKAVNKSLEVLYPERRATTPESRSIGTGDEIASTTTHDRPSYDAPQNIVQDANTPYTNTDKQGEVLPHEANLLYGKVENEPVIEPVQVTEADITGKPEPKEFSWKTTPEEREAIYGMPAKLFQGWVDNNREAIDVLPRDNIFGNLGLGIAEIGQDYLDLLAHPVRTAQGLKHAAQFYKTNPEMLAGDLLRAGVIDPIKYWSDPQKMYENPAYPLQYVNNLMMALEGGRQLGNIGKNIYKNSANAIDAFNEMADYYDAAQYGINRWNRPPETDIVKTFDIYKKINPFDKDITPEKAQVFYDYVKEGYHPPYVPDPVMESDPFSSWKFYKRGHEIDPSGNLGEFLATGKIKRPSILKDSSFYPEETLVNIEDLPKQSPTSRILDAPYEIPKILHKSEIKQMAEDVAKSKAAEPVKNYNKMIKEYGGVENFNKMLDEIPSGMSPEDLAKYRTLWLSNQRSIMGGGNQADVLAELNRQTIVDPSLNEKGAFGSYSKGGLTQEGIQEVKPSLKDVNKGIDFDEGVYRVLPEGILREGSRRPFLDIGKQDVPATDSYYHELTHGLNDLADKLETKAAIDYARRYNYPSPTNESASLGMESLDLTNEAVDPRLINAYKQVGYDAELSNPSMQKYRKLYQQDIDRYKKMIDLGLVKVNDHTILNEEALMRRLDPNYISPEVQKYLYNIDDIGTGKMFEGFNGQW